MSTHLTRSSPAAERILRTAAELIAVRGYSATSTRDIAAAVGVRQPAIYKHFSSKDDILAALVRLGLQRPLALADELTGLTAPAVAKLHRWLRESLNHLHDSPYVLVSILSTPELQRERFAAELDLVAQFDRAVIGMVEAGQEEGDIRAMNPVSGARLVQALFDALALPEIAVSPAEIVEFAMTGLLADPARLPEIQRAADALALTPPEPA
ncbi:TetR/AcrR family transcriptional regulator [Nocardia sp. NPDC049149]|uniref:TetR/AcrR family transcriptional regulator n=1 Tax=Nocardia sp. NPDC049149 TaxID=3364315 RepID=UPI00371F4B97